VRVLITGATGFVGRFVADHLAETDPSAEVWGLVWSGGSRQLPASVTAVSGDLTVRSSLDEAIRTCRPEVVVHLASASSVALSWKDPQRYLETNLAGTISLFEAILGAGLGPRVVIASSAEVYGAVPDDQQPIGEDMPLRPLSPYGESKAAVDLAAQQYSQRSGLDTVRLRLFHHTGPGRPPSFVAASFARQIAAIELGLRPPRLEVGNLEAIRDFTDVRDIARAYPLAAARCPAGSVYNVCSGTGTSIRQLLNRLLRLAELEVEVAVDSKRLRANDIPCLVGDASRFSEATGWRPEINLDRTLGDLLDWWRQHLRST
jgi:GDP-4-dehydro-6-deoxy-D-mannose reductase